MIGIVIVSHSARLAAGVAELARQMVREEVPIAVAGGIDDPEQDIGTDTMKVYEAINAVYSEDGVLVFMDLGSAVLSTEMALEFLPEEKRQHIRLSAAPIVEGTLAAVVQASTGASLEQVAAEAMRALTPKQQQLPGAEVESEEPAREMPAPAGTHTMRLSIRNRLGLHARPAAQFVRTANRFKAEIKVYKAGAQEQVANAKSINAVATLGVRQDDEIVITASGSDATDALGALQQLVADNFGEDGESEIPLTTATTRPTAATADELRGIAASPGIAIGPVVQYRPRLPEVDVHTVEDAGSEWRALQQALAAARGEIGLVRRSTARQAGEGEAAIFDAHELILQDPALLDAVRARILNEHTNAAAAWQAEVELLATRYRELADEYMQARAADVIDVGQRVLNHLIDAEPPSPTFAQPSILVAASLTPSDTARLDPAQVLGICTEGGGATAHSAILARAFGIPAVVGLGPVLQTLAGGQVIAMDGTSGQVWPEPTETQLATLQEAQQEWLGERQEAKAAAQQPAITRDEVRIEIAANIGAPHDAPLALEFGAEGVGLFRTEFLFLEREQAPTETEQVDAYRQAAEVMGNRPLIIRTLDVGGDKPVPYLEHEPETNPFLGQRGIRFSLGHRELFMSQLRAILRAGTAGNVKVMLPMVSAVEEVRAVKKLLDEAKQTMRGEGIRFDEAMELGIMIEVPAAVAIADQLAQEVDFFSIGTNDLTQYVMAADRGNRDVAALADALQPAVLRLIRQTAIAAHNAGIWVGICGELAGNALATPVLVGLGIDELSMNAPAIPAVKERIRRLTIAEAEEKAATALALTSASEVRAFLGD